MGQRISFEANPSVPSVWDIWLAKQVKAKVTNAEWKVTQLSLGQFGDHFWASYNLAKKMSDM